MNKSKLVTIVLILALILAIFAGCQVQNAEIPTEPLVSSQPTKPTEPSDEVTEPSSEAAAPTIPLTVENIRAYVKEGMTYEQVIALIGRNEKDMSGDPLEFGYRVWFIGDCKFTPTGLGVIGGPYVKILFIHPKTMELYQGDWVFPGPGQWRLEMEVVSVAIYWEDGTEEILFGSMKAGDYLDTV